VPGIVTLLLVLAAAAAGFLIGRPASDDAEVTSISSDSGVSVSLPPGWAEAATPARVPGLDLQDGVSAVGPDGRSALVAGRLPGLRGTVYTTAVATRVDPRPPRPRAVALSSYEALRYPGLEPRGGRQLTLFVAPTGGGTLAAA
jgi:hypothetical protein